MSRGKFLLLLTISLALLQLQRVSALPRGSDRAYHRGESPEGSEDPPEYGHPQVGPATIGDGLHNTPYANWDQLARDSINARVQRKLNTNVAKNVIFFLGDGMGVPTMHAARVHRSQKDRITLDKVKLAWDNFLDTGMVQTYNVDASVPDSAGTATAFLCGKKARSGVIGVNENVVYADNCSTVVGNECKSSFHYAMDAGKWAGLVSTARITHATPASAYAHSSSRNWEYDYGIPSAYRAQCTDIAWQMVKEPANKDIRVILGGGRRNFYMNTEADPEGGGNGYRRDVNLVEEWKNIKRQTYSDESKFPYVTDKTAFDSADPNSIEFLFGLFERSHMQYETDRADDVAGEPSLAEMVEKSINLLKRSEDGYFLFVEGGRIDHAHHETRAQKALVDTWALSDAVQKALDMTNQEDTLVVVTADHSHVFTMGGYTHIDNDLYGLARESDGYMPQSTLDQLPFYGLMYANGPGMADHRDMTGIRNNNSAVQPAQYNDKEFRQDTAVQIGSETHGGEDVTVFARGPWSHLFSGTVEQSYLAHAMMYAGCFGPGAKPEHCNPANGNTPILPATTLLITTCLITVKVW